MPNNTSILFCNTSIQVYLKVMKHINKHSSVWNFQNTETNYMDYMEKIMLDVVNLLNFNALVKEQIIVVLKLLIIF